MAITPESMSDTQINRVAELEQSVRDPVNGMTPDELASLGTLIPFPKAETVTLATLARDCAETSMLDGLRGKDIPSRDPDYFHKMVVAYWQETPRELLDCLADYEEQLVDAYAKGDTADLGRQVGLRMFSSVKDHLIRMIDVAIEEREIANWQEGIDSTRDGFEE